MTKVLVTGAAGMLGRHLVPRLLESGFAVRGMSRRARPAGLPAGAEWVSADVETGAGLADALAGTEVIVHAASSARLRSYEIDVAGTQRLVDAAAAQGIAHLVYISIVGIDRIPRPYYRNKVAAEEAIMAGHVPWTILRTTQFHNLIDNFIHGYQRGPFIVAPLAYRYQPVDVGEVAAALCDCAAREPGRRVPDMGGPEVMTLRQLITPWLAAHRLRRIAIPRIARAEDARAFQLGYNTCPDHRQGRITWADWLRTHAAQP